MRIWFTLFSALQESGRAKPKIQSVVLVHAFRLSVPTGYLAKSIYTE